MRRAKEILPKGHVEGSGALYQAVTPDKWPDGKMEWLAENVDLIVVLCNRGDAELAALTDDNEHGLTYWHLPVPDSHKTVDGTIVEHVVPTLVNWILSGKSVLVCCLAGRSRSGATAALTVRELYNVTGSEALDYARTRRPNSVKREGPEAFIRALEKPRPGEDSLELPS